MQIIFNLLLSLVLTIIVEVPLTKTLLNKKNIVKNTILINTITNLSLNLLNLNLYGILSFEKYFCSIIILETIIPYIEFKLLKYCYEDIDTASILKYIYLINLTSFVLGELVYKYIIL